MKKVHLIIDSTADLPLWVREKTQVVPLKVRFDDEEFIDGVTITHKEFYEKLVESDVLPCTSQASPLDFDHVLHPIVEAGDSAVVITLASKLSGTYQSASIASEEMDDVYVVDSESVAIGGGILVWRALQLVEQGLSAKEIAEQLDREKQQIHVIALVDTLEYLKKGGRLSKTAAFAGGLLNIKPVVGVRHGEIQVLGKARGSKQGNNLLVKEIEAAGGVDFDRPVLLGYTGLTDAMVQKYKEDSEHLWKHAKEELHVVPIGSVIGTHVGGGAVAVAFFEKG